MENEKKGDKKKVDEKKIKKASLSQVVKHLNESIEEDDNKQQKRESAQAADLLNEKPKKNKKDKKEITKSKKANEIAPVDLPSTHEIAPVDLSTTKEIAPVDLPTTHEVAPVDLPTTKEISPVDSKKDTAKKEKKVAKEIEELQLSGEEEPYSKKKIRQAESLKKKENRKKGKTEAKDKPTDEKSKENKKIPEKKDKKKLPEGKEQNKREKRAAAVEPPFDSGKKLTRAERAELKRKTKGAGVSSKDYMRLLKEGENKDLKDVPYEAKGINQFPTRTKADAEIKKPVKGAKGQAAPRFKTSSKPKKNEKKK